jgi:hypothetical protein
MAITFAPDLAALIPLLASVRARKLARLSGGAADQTRAEDDTRTPATSSEDAA